MKPPMCLYLFLLLSINGVPGLTRRMPMLAHNQGCSCGESNPLGVRIMGGSSTSIKNYPWQALILYDNKQHCGGSVINDRYILTAGHCVSRRNTQQLSVILGLDDRLQMNSGSERHFAVTQVTIHENFLAKQTHDLRDIALLRLNDTITFGPFIRPVCLSPEGAHFEGKVATITGWGRKGYTELPTRRLTKTMVKVLSKNQCLASKIGMEVAEDTNSMFCAYARNKDACQGDSGGPMVYQTMNGVTFQIGVISWGEKCGLIDYPGVYTQLSSFYNWILDHTKDAMYCNVPFGTADL